MNPIVSIVANFYKSGKFIPQLIKSVLSQTFSDWELICVNDCSPGKDQSILEAFAAKDSRIKVINNSINLGICKAKMVGIRAASGKYITFIDGDDWLAQDALEKMLSPACAFDLDLVVMNYYRSLPLFHYNKKCRSNVELWDTPIKGEDVMRDYYINFFGKNYFSVAYWGKLYKRSIIDESGFQPPKDVFAEDLVFSMTVFPYVKSMMFIDYYGYYWRWGGYSCGKENNFWTSKHGMIRSNELFLERLELIEKYHYNRAYLELLKQQRKDVLNYISDVAIYDINSNEGEKIVEFVKDILVEPAYSKLMDLKKLESSYSEDKLIDMIVNRDSQGVYNYCYQNRRNQRFSRFARKELLRILNIFS